MSKVFFIVQSELMTGGVIEAQVIASLRAQCAVAGQPTTRLIFLESWRQVAKPNVRATLRKFRALWPEGRISLVPYSERAGGAAAPGLALALALWRERFSRDDLIFHCRGASATVAADYARRRLGRGRVIFDVRGAAPYEAIHRQGCAWRENLTPQAEHAWSVALQEDRAGAQAADALFVVSPGLKDYAVNLLDVIPQNIAWVPSCVAGTNYDAANRRLARERWSARDDTPVLLYSGRLGPERLPQYMFRLFRAMLSVEPAAKLVILSYLNELPNLKELREAAGVPAAQVIVDELPRDEVVKVLPGADVAAIFLEPALRFQLALPIKLAEYLGAGVPLVVNDTFAWIPDAVRERGLGWVLGQPVDETQITETARLICKQTATERDALRQRALAMCEEYFVWPRYVPVIRRVYGL